MLSAVIQNYNGEEILVAVFLMEFDAREFVENQPQPDNYEVRNVDSGAWQSWVKMRKEILG